MKQLLATISLYFLIMFSIIAEDRLELETTFIKGNKELPQIIYIVPWKDIKSSRKKPQKIVLYSLFGDLFDPINPDDLNHNVIDE